MKVVSINYLLEAGVQYGHQKRRWNPKMKEYIFNERDGIYIVDLEKTSTCLEKAYDKVKEVAMNGGKIIWVGTKRQAVDAIEEVATIGDNYYVNHRWLGGTLTNFRTIRKRIRRLDEIEKMREDGTFDLLPKKEVLEIEREYLKLNNNLKGIREMSRLPELMIVVDVDEEDIAVKEARKLNIPVIGIVGTNSDPETVDYPIPANDDAVKSITLILNVLNNPVLEALGKETKNFLNEEDSKVVKVTKEKEDKEEIKEEEPVKEEVKEPEKSEEELLKEKYADVKFEDKTLAELKEIARENKLTGYSTLKKTDLINLIEKSLGR